MSKKDYTVDIHCHPSLRAMNTSSNNIWNKVHNPDSTTAVGRWAQLKTHDMSRQSQCNLQACADAGVRVIVDAMHPLEKGWYDFRLMPSLLMKRSSRDEMLKVVSGVSDERLKIVASRDNYFLELEENYAFLALNQGVNESNGWNYQLVENYGQLQRVLEIDNVIAVIVSIEGGHAFGVGSPLMLQKSEAQLCKLLCRNIQKVKEWKYPPLYLTLTHFFWNQLSGHARSLKSPINLLFSQNYGLDLGITKLGWITIEELLTRRNGKRIQVDIKHMSALARKQYYAFVKRNNSINTLDKIPVICTHTGVSVIKTLDDVMNKRSGLSSYFNNWDINMCDEDIHVIHDSGGFMGLILDKVMLADPDLLRDISFTSSATKRKEKYIKVIWDNIFHVIKVIGKKSGWNIPTLGSDYDGMISHIEFYETVSDLPDLKQSMIDYLHKYEYQKELWYGNKPENLVLRVFQANAMRFLKTYFV